MDQLSVETDTTRSTTSSIREVAHHLQQSVTELERGLAAAGKCWGSTDEVAHAFQQSYEPKSGEVLKAGHDSVQLLRGLGDLVARSMQGYEQVETDNRDVAAS